jgi:hypothetical protein
LVKGLLLKLKPKIYPKLASKQRGKNSFFWIISEFSQIAFREYNRFRKAKT